MTIDAISFKDDSNWPNLRPLKTLRPGFLDTPDTVPFLRVHRTWTLDAHCPAHFRKTELPFTWVQHIVLLGHNCFLTGWMEKNTCKVNKHLCHSHPIQPSGWTGLVPGCPTPVVEPARSPKAMVWAVPGLSSSRYAPGIWKIIYCGDVQCLF